MVNVTLTDNNIAAPPLLTDICDEENQIPVYEDLQFVAGQNLNTLCKENSGLLVFPDYVGNHKDGIEELSVLEFDGCPEYREDKIVSCDKIKIKTGNLMGFIGIDGKGQHNTHIEIRSRFTDNNGQDYFLHYMLEKVFRINLFDMKYSFDSSEGFDFIYLLFPYFLRKAVRQGVFRTYRNFEKNDDAVKGPVNISSHIRQNIPFNGRIAYRCREYTSDNHITQLIRHTIEYIKTKKTGAGILNQDSETIQAVRQISEMTNSGYSPQKRSKVLYDNFRLINHPYFTEYNRLQKLCLMILNHRKIRYVENISSENKIYGILFDGAWLWEEYLATILCDPKYGEKKFEHPENKTGKGGIRLFDNSYNEESSFSKCYRRIYPDFYRKNSTDEENDGTILDVKYKHLDNAFVRDDLYQVIAYMHTMKIDAGGFIYPCRDEYKKDDFRLAGYGGNIYRIGFGIPQEAKNYKDFCKKIMISEESLRNSLFLQ